MLYDCKRISYWIDRRLTGLAGPDYAATISFGLPLEPEDSQYGKSRVSIHLTQRGYVEGLGLSAARIHGPPGPVELPGVDAPFV